MCHLFLGKVCLAHLPLPPLAPHTSVMGAPNSWGWSTTGCRPPKSPIVFDCSQDKPLLTQFARHTGGSVNVCSCYAGLIRQLCFFQVCICEICLCKIRRS